jgi:hypothetical protein
MAVTYTSPIVSVVIGNSKSQSIKSALTVGNFKAASMNTALMLGNYKSASATIGVKSGYVFISWAYDPTNKRAVGTLTSPLYHSAQFKLKATEGLKNVRAKKIKNPQEIDYSTTT